MWYLLLVTGFFVVLGQGVPTSVAAQGSLGLETLQVEVDGKPRTYFQYVPRQAPSRGAPLILAFHGGGGQALQFARRTELQRIANFGGAVILIPEGLGRPDARGGSWNAGNPDALGFSERTGVDDLAFVEAMIAQAKASLSINLDQLYAVGFSKGGMMAYHVACALDDRFQAIAVVAGTLDAVSCSHATDVSLLHIHGTSDESVPFEGGSGAHTARWRSWSAVERGLDIFRTANTCEPAGRALRVAEDTTCFTSQCDGRQEVQLCLVEGGGHSWPGASPARWQQQRGVSVSPNFDATTHIAEFFFGR
jgi:polyhydroxybutyrate depolymerase